MVDKYKAVLAALEAEMGPVSLFALLKIDDLTDRWSLLVSAPWTSTNEERKSSFKSLISQLSKHLTEEEANQVARVGVWPLEDHLVTDLLKFKKGTYIDKPTPVNGNVVHEGYILESEQPKGHS
ncbi:MAG TPA: hypothetical protein VLI05_06335 [Candidatus Saccharimonadia bacterium]|nr:hypothetical protein [Candidatus Saccharimonadia bacterium]